MNIADISSRYQASSKINLLAEKLKKSKHRIHLKGLVGSSFSFVGQALFEKIDCPFLVLFADKEKAAYYLNDLERLVGDSNVLFYPSSYKKPYQIEKTDNANILLRAEVLNQIHTSKTPKIIVSYPEAIFEKVVTKKELDKNTLKINLGDQISIDFVNEILFEYEFKRVDFVSEPGEFSVRGGIVDVFSFSNDHPYRIEFFGNEIDSMRTFDISTQLSIAKQTQIVILPNLENKTLQDNRESFLNYILENSILITDNFEAAQHTIDVLFQKATEIFNSLNSTIKQLAPADLYINASEFSKQALQFSVMEWCAAPLLKTDTLVEFHTKPQPSFNKQFDLLFENLEANQSNGITNFIASANPQQAQRLETILSQSIPKNTSTRPIHTTRFLYLCLKDFVMKSIK